MRGVARPGWPVPHGCHGGAFSRSMAAVLDRAELEGLDHALAASLSARGADAHRDRDSRRAQGAYFTPAPLVAFVVARTLDARLALPGVTWRPDGSPRLRVLDPCAGDGRFLAAAVDYLSAHARALGHGDARDAIARQCIVGIERDPQFAALARARLGVDIHCREALLDPPRTVNATADAPVASTAHAAADATMDATMDVVIGNPPYLRSIHLARADPSLRARLQGRYAATSYGEWDLYAAFIEQSLAWTGPHGQVGLVVPSRWLTAAFAAPLRALLARAAAVRGIVDFGAAQIFPGATTYPCVLLLSRAPVAQVAVARRTAAGWRCGQVPASALSAAPWRLMVGARRRLIDRLARAAPGLGEVARIAKGTGTNADPVFVIEQAEERDGVVTGTSKAAGGPVRVEAAACRPCARGRDVRAWGAVSGAVRCIVPYDASGGLWSEAELAAHPLAAAHLARFRPRLEARESGRFAGPQYYRFGRPQNLAFLADARPKIVVPDVARHGRALVDAAGALVLDSAYAVRPRDEQVHGNERAHGDVPAHGYGVALIAAVLNAPLVRLWLRETGVLLRGEYVRLKTAYLRSLPLPPRSPATAQAEALAARVLALTPATAGRDTLLAQVHEALREAYGIARADWDVD